MPCKEGPQPDRSSRVALILALTDSGPVPRALQFAQTRLQSRAWFSFARNRPIALPCCELPPRGIASVQDRRVGACRSCLATPAISVGSDILSAGAAHQNLTQWLLCLRIAPLGVPGHAHIGLRDQQHFAFGLRVSQLIGNPTRFCGECSPVLCGVCARRHCSASPPSPN